MTQNVHFRDMQKIFLSDAFFDKRKNNDEKREEYENNTNDNGTKNIREYKMRIYLCRGFGGGAYLTQKIREI